MQRRKSNAAGRDEHEAPVASIDYNARMGGVDVFDQIREHRSVHLRSTKWWKVMFSFVLDSALSNAYHLYCALWDRPGSIDRGKKKDRTDFNCAVARGLCGDDRLQSGEIVTFAARKRRKPGRPSTQYRPSQKPKKETRMGVSMRDGDRPKPRHRCPHQALRVGDERHLCQRCRWYNVATGTGKMRHTKHYCAMCNTYLCPQCMEYWHGGNWMPEDYDSCHGSHRAGPGIPPTPT
jgi:hypothetical protein